MPDNLTSDLRLHAICTYLRNKQCERCPATEQSPYGESTRGCRLAAQEVANIAVHGNPWGADAIPEHVQAWQGSYNNG